MQKVVFYTRYMVTIFIVLLLSALCGVQGLVFPFFMALSCALIFSSYNKYVVSFLTVVVLLITTLDIWQIGATIFCLLFINLAKIIIDKKGGVKTWLLYCLFLLSQSVFIYFQVFVQSIPYVAVMYICLSLASFVIFKIFLNAYKTQPFLYRLRNYELFALCFFVLILAGGLCYVNVPYVNVYHLIGIFTILVVSRLTKPGMCLTYSAMYGLGSVLSFADVSYIAMFVLVALTASFLQTKTNVYSCLGVIIVQSLLGLYFNCLPFFTYVTIIETLLACAMQFCITQNRIKMLRVMFVDDQNDFSIRDLANRNRVLAKAKLMDLSNVFFELDVVFKKMLKGDLPIEEAKNLLVDEVFNKVCNKCKDRAKCSKYLGVQKEVESLMCKAFEKGKVSLLDISSNMANNCLKTAQIITLINRLVNQYKQYSTMMKNLDNSRLLIADQLCGVAKIMQNLSLDFDNKIQDSDSVENQILETFEKIGVACAEALVYGRVGEISSIALLIKNSDLNKLNLEQIISELVGQKMCIAQSYPSDTTGWFSVVMEPKASYSVLCGLYVQNKNGNDVSGDCYSMIPINNNKFLMAISDGMGHGEKAKKNSELTISVIENFYRAGFDNDIVLSSVNKLVCINQLDEFASLDLCVIDLKNAFIDMVKLGASQSYIKHEHNTTVIEGKALPLGVVEEVQAQIQKSAVQDGDLIILCSDGVADSFGGLDSLAMYINHLEEYSPQEVATCIGERARLMCKGDIRDDVTILVGRIVKTN